MSTATVVLLAGVATIVVAFMISAFRRPHADFPDLRSAEAAVRRSIWRHPRVRRFLSERLDRRSAGGLMLTVAFAVTIAMAFGVGLVLDLIDASPTVARIDASIARWGSDNASTSAVGVLKAVTQLGSTSVAVVVLGATATIDFVRRRNASVFAFVAVVGVGQVVLNNLLKVIVARERPSVLQLVGTSGMSFPSGHAASAAAVWSAVALIVARDRQRSVRAAAAVVAVGIAVAVATSRALLGVHWVSDVLAGLILGWGWFLLVAIVFGGRRQRLGDPVAASPPESGSAARRCDAVQRSLP